MEYATLGQTDVRISRIGFGGEQLGGHDWGKFAEKECIAAIDRALELGINFFDTADVYGLGKSEEVLATGLGSQRHEVVIATKFGVNWEHDSDAGRARTFYDASPKRVVEAVEGSLRRLKIDSIPLYQVHWPDPSVPVADTMEALVKCQEQGKIQHIGYANATPAVIAQAFQVHRLESLQAPYNLLHRRIEGATIQCCAALQMSVLAYGPLAQGLLTGKYGRNSTFAPDDRRHRLRHFQGSELDRSLEIVDRLREVSSSYGKSITQVALRWVLDSPSVTAAIVGMKTPGQADENAGAACWKLSATEVAYLGGRCSPAPDDRHF